MCGTRGRATGENGEGAEGRLELGKKIRDGGGLQEGLGATQLHSPRTWNVARSHAHASPASATPVPHADGAVGVDPGSRPHPVHTQVETPVLC